MKEEGGNIIAHISKRTIRFNESSKTCGQVLRLGFE
jgi:hypothetical protein